jgi:hypothetical protein
MGKKLIIAGYVVGFLLGGVGLLGIIAAPGFIHSFVTSVNLKFKKSRPHKSKALRFFFFKEHQTAASDRSVSTMGESAHRGLYDVSLV